MARRRDIHKIDNYLIRFGWLALIWSLLATGCAASTTPYRLEHAGGRVEQINSSEDIETVRRSNPGADVTALDSGPPAIWLWMLVASVLMLGAGYYVRAAEKRALMVWDILDEMVEVRAGDLAASTGLTLEKLRETLAVVNAQPGAFFVWDADTDIIVDGRLRKRVIHVDRCSSCGAATHVTLTLDLSTIPACTYCGGSVSSMHELQRLRREALDAIQDDDSRDRKPFSVLIFVLLLLFFWPAALAYALWKGGVLDQLIDKFQSQRRPA